MKHLTKFGNPVTIKKICEWTKKEFTVDWKHKHQRFIDKNAMYEWRKAQNHEIAKCLNCGNSFDRYKHILHPRTGKTTQFCSNFCSQTSQLVYQKRKNWGLSDKNHWNNKDCQKKGKHTRLRMYGDVWYNNIDKMINTNTQKYGVPYTWYLPKCKSNGKRISGFQKREYIKIIQQYPDAILEHYLPDVKKSVDIYIPSIRKVIECFGDYWHCNPTKCKSNYYNRLVHMTAQEIWDKDKHRIELLKQNGYDVEIIWENTNKQLKHTID